MVTPVRPETVAPAETFSDAAPAPWVTMSTPEAVGAETVPAKMLTVLAPSPVVDCTPLPFSEVTEARALIVTVPALAVYAMRPSDASWPPLTTTAAESSIRILPP